MFFVKYFPSVVFEGKEQTVFVQQHRCSKFLESCLSRQPFLEDLM